MKKLLHERLREIDEIHTSEIKVQGVDVRLFQVEAIVLADEIERYYIPRPRFEDGEPVQFGDDIEGCNGKVESILLFEDGSGTVYGEDDECLPKKHCGADIDEEGLKRPKPKVLDADGAEIKVGDTVWDKEGNKLEVKDIEPSDYPEEQEHLVWCGLYKRGFKLWNIADQLTHKEPDSLIKLRDDVLKWRARYSTSTPYEAVESIGDEIADRLSALIERGA